MERKNLGSRGMISRRREVEGGALSLRAHTACSMNCDALYPLPLPLPSPPHTDVDEDDDLFSICVMEEGDPRRLNGLIGPDTGLDTPWPGLVPDPFGGDEAIDGDAGWGVAADEEEDEDEEE